MFRRALELSEGDAISSDVFMVVAEEHHLTDLRSMHMDDAALSKRQVSSQPSMAHQWRINQIDD